MLKHLNLSYQPQFIADYKSDISFLKLKKIIAINNNDPVRNIILVLFILIQVYD